MGRTSYAQLCGEHSILQYQLKSISPVPFRSMSLLETNLAFLQRVSQRYLVRNTCTKCVAAFYFQDHCPLISLISFNAVQEHKPWITVWAKTLVGCEGISRFPTQASSFNPTADSEYFFSLAPFCTFTPILRRVNPSCPSKEKASPITCH